MSGDCDIPFVVLEKHLREKSLVEWLGKGEQLEATVR